MAMLRGAKPAPELIDNYAGRLAQQNEGDVLEALEKIAEMPRHEGELAFPELGAVVAMVNAIGVARRKREALAREVYQQQVCAKCGDVRGMMVKIDSQMRTWCAHCQRYRKIIPEDLALSEDQWNAICAALTFGYAEGQHRGAKMEESATPIDRATGFPVEGLGPVYEIDVFASDGLPSGLAEGVRQ